MNNIEGVKIGHTPYHGSVITIFKVRTQVGDRYMAISIRGRKNPPLFRSIAAAATCAENDIDIERMNDAYNKQSVVEPIEGQRIYQDKR